MKRVWLPAFVLMSLATASAQQDMGSVTGTVRDSSDAVLPGVRVMATELATGVITETTTNAEGLYTLPALKIGHYRVAAELSGFKRAVADSVQISAQSRVRVDLQLELGAMTEEVSVKADAPLLQTETSLLARVLREDEIKELPLNGRNFQQLAVLAAGVLPAFGHRDREGGFNSHGQWATQNNFILDGIDNNSQVLGMEDRKAQVLIPNLDAVQEFQIQTSNYSAEFGRNAGAVMNVSIKSGTNQVKGTAYEFARHDRFDARDAFTYADRDGDGKADPEELRQHQFGITIGGPIRANRTFLFASVEALRSRTTEGSAVTVPTLLERQGIFDPAIVTIRDPATGQPFPGNAIPRNRWDPVAAGLIRLFPEPNHVDTTRDNYVSSPKHVRDRYQYDLRLDHNFSAANKAFVRVSRMDIRDDRDGPLPPPAVGAPNNETSLNNNQAHSLALSATRIIGPRVVNEARFGFNALETDKHPLVADAVNEQFGLRVVAPQPVTGLARTTFSGALGYVTLGDATFTPNYKLSRTFQALDNLTLIHGRHSLKTGVDLRWIQADIVGAPQTRGIFNFNGKFTGSSLGDFLLGMTNTRQFSTFQQGNLRERNFMFYVQDDWKIGPRLTLNLGMRYELSSPMFDAQDRMTTLDLSAIPAFRVVRAGEAGDSWSSRGLVDTDPNNWAPRIGFAWQPASRWSVRGAAGVFYGTTGGGLGASSRLINNWPIFRDVTIRSTPTRSAGQLADGLDPSVLGSTDVMPDNLNWNVWARDFKLPMVEQWNLSVQRQLGSELTGTVSYVGSSSLYLPRSFNMNSADIGPPATERQRRPIPALGTITFRETSGKASYHGMEATLDKRLSAGLQFSLAYTWSRSIDDVAELFGAEGGIVQDVRNLPGDRGHSGFDRRHRFSGSSVYELPFGAGRRWLGDGAMLGRILGGWQMSAIISMQSGRYFDVTVPDPTTLLGVTSSNWRADLVGDPRPANPGPDGWLNAAAFTVPRNADGSYRFGNLRRNSLLGPGYFNLDGGLMRSFRLGAARRLQVRWEVFNATNHPSYGLPTTNLLSRDFGTIRGTVGNPRQMQFGLKFIY
jgi:Carboxypeptidase regulatory-like domain/TonB dependent receptor-like, beta-barrel